MPSGAIFGYRWSIPARAHDDRAMSRARRPRVLSRLLEARTRQVCICLGAGGVGKTTTSAALALGLAGAGAKVAVVTIDPAARLAQALGLQELSAEPRLLDPASFARQGVRMRGELWAMVLDVKRTLDDAVAGLAADERSRDEILSNPIYRELSSAVAGSQELSAIAKLYELCHERDFDVIVLDTPPSRNAVDFIEAPARLLGFLEGRALKLFLAPGSLAARALGRSTGLALGIFSRLTGVDMFGELSTFFRSSAGVLDGFSERTRSVAALLRDPATTFLLVTSPEPEPAREAIFLADRLDAAQMRCGGLIVNRLHVDYLGGRTPRQVSDHLAQTLAPSLAARLGANLADFDVLAQRDRETVARLSTRLAEPEPLLVPELAGDVTDIAGLARVAEHLFSGHHGR
jgi:anion-transporting  ArsA/GET3 family ATPase